MKKTAIILSLILCSVACREMPEAYDVWPDWGEEMPDPMVINGAESDETPYEGQPAWNLDLVDGQQLSFSGFRGVARMLQPDWFDSVAKDGDSYVAEFHGNDGKYRMVYDQKNGFFFLEQPGTEFPDGVWLIGAGWGHGNSASATVSKGWALGGANDVGYPKKIGESRWQYTLFLDSGFSFKFFRKRAWNNEITSNDVKCLCPFTITGKANGDFVPGPFFEKGVYTILLDTEEKTLGIADYSFEVAYKINGEPLGVLPDGASMLGISLDLNTGDEIEFTSNFGDISKILQPDMMEAVSAAKARFKGPSGKWNLFYDVNSKLIYMENRSLAYPASIWIQGAGFGHPAAGRTSVKGWVWDSPADCFQMLPVENGVYETTVFLNGNAELKFYKKRGWGEADEITSMECDPLPADKLEKGWNNHFTGNFVASDSFEAGVYKIRVDVNQNVVALMDFMQESDVKPAEPAVNGVKLAWRTVGDKEYLAADLSLAKGQKMDFKGFNTLQRLLQPDFYKFNDGNIVFLAPDGDYSIYYLPDLELLYTEYHMDAGYPETLWIGGNGRFTSPWADASSGGKFISPWNTWKHPTGPFYRICCVKTGEDTYEATLYIASGAQNFGQFRFYLRCQTNPWECFSANKAENDNDKPAKDRLSQYYQGAYFQAKSDNFVPKGEANCEAGVYHVVADIKNQTMTYTKIR